MIGHVRVHFWLGWAFAIAFAGAVSPLYHPATVILATLVLGGGNFLALYLSWRNREAIEKIKPLSDAMAVFGLLLFVFLIFNANLVVALTWFLAFVQLALNLTFKEDRHFYFVLLTSFILLLVGAAESKSGAYLFFVIGYVIATSICMGFYFMDRRLRQSAVSAGPMHWPVGHRANVIVLLILTSTVIYLVLPRFEAANFGSRYGAADQYYHDKSWEQQADKPQQQDKAETDTESSGFGGSSTGAQGEGQSPVPMNNTGTGQNGQGSGESSGESSGQSEEQYRYRGFEQSFDIRGEQQPSRVPANVVVAYMRAKHGAYLKVETFDEFDGVSWHKSRTSDVKRKLQFGEISLLDHTQPNYRQNITIDVDLGPYLPAAAVPVGLAFPATVISIDTYGMIKIPAGLRRGTRYTVDSLVQYAQGRLLAGDQVPPSDNDLQLPADLDARVQALAEQVTADAATDLAKASRLEQHLRDNYEYSLASVFNSQNRTPVGRFLFEDKKGHCEYFASAMAVMLRSVGIPTRLVTGFSATVANPLTEYYEIRALDGHAWVEAWIDKLGWVVYEPTPPYNLPVPENKIISMERIQEYVDQLEHMQREHGLEGEVSLQNIMISLWQTLSTSVVVLLSYIKLVLLNGWKWLVAGAAVFIVALFLWRRWKPYYIKGLSYFKVLAYTPRDTKAAVRFYLRHIQIVMRINGTARQPGTTIEQYSRQMNEAAGENPLMQKAVSLINQIHYAPETDVTLDPLILKQAFIQVYKKS